MKYTITIETEDQFEKEAIIEAVKNKLLIEQLYDDVFRPVIKYGNDEVEIENYVKIWGKIHAYLNN